MAISYQGAFDKMQEKGVDKAEICLVGWGKYTVTKYPAKNEGREICNDGNNRTALPAAGLHPKRFNENHEVKTPPTHTAPGAFRRLPSRVFNIFRC